MQLLHEQIVAQCHHSHRWFIERGYLVTWNLWPLSLHHHRWQRVSNFNRRRTINESHWWQKYTPIGRHASNSCSPNDSEGAGVSWCVLSGAVLCLMMMTQNGTKWSCLSHGFLCVPAFVWMTIEAHDLAYKHCSLPSGHTHIWPCLVQGQVDHCGFVSASVGRMRCR